MCAANLHVIETSSGPRRNSTIFGVSSLVSDMMMSTGTDDGVPDDWTSSPVSDPTDRRSAVVYGAGEPESDREFSVE